MSKLVVHAKIMIDGVSDTPKKDWYYVKKKDS